MKIKPLGIILIGAILLLNIFMIRAFADVPSVPHSADAMWVEPLSVTFDTSNVSVGTTKFNVTVWLNMTEDVYTYQIGMLYNHTQLKCTRAGYTGTGASMYFSGHTTSSPPPVIDTSFLGNGSILATETCQGTDFIPGPNSGSLMWAEFQVQLIPTVGNLTSKFDITTKYPTFTWVKDSSLIKITLTTYNADYELIGPSGPRPLSVTISPSSASVGVNQSLTFSSNATGGTPPYGYQWFLNGSSVPSATSSTWTFSSPTNDTYVVYLNVTDSVGGIAISNNASVAVVLRLLSDVNGDGVVDGSDIALASKALGSYGPDFLYPGSPASPRWNPDADISQNGAGDGVIDGLDLVTVCIHFGQSLKNP
jgi:hypothetical protein